MRFAEFFAGIGLMRMGLEKSGWTCAFANDIDPKKFEMYRGQFPDADEHFWLGDIRQIEPRRLPEVDLATASFPCTDLSLAGGRAGLAGANSSALWPFLDLLRKADRTRPRLVLLENVPGFLTSHGGMDLKSALLSLNRLGYLVDAFVADAAKFVPQSRSRLFVLGVYDPSYSPTEKRPSPQRTHLESELRPSSLAKFIFENDDVEWRIRELPSLPTERSPLTHLLDDFPEGASEWWSVERATYLLNQMSPRHRAVANEMIDGNHVTVGTVFRRVRSNKSMAELRIDGMAGCLRTPKGGSARQILFFGGAGSFKVRLVTPRECSRLMGAGDFKITVPAHQALFGFGDAVCVPVVDWIARNYLNLVLKSNG
jgi:DNA (cytosine-5)-methyltransferase 1